MSAAHSSNRKTTIRNFGVKVKLNPIKELLAGKRVVLIDDSIVRGTTSRKIVKMVRAAGATEVHMRISCPPTISPCFYGSRHADQKGIDRLQPHSRRDLTSTLKPIRWLILSLPGLLKP